MPFNARHLSDRRYLSILLLGFASGLPFSLAGTTLSFWLAERSVSIGTIGLFTLVSLPYSLKFLWAPIIDQTRLKFFTGHFGQRRGWGLFIQLLLAAAILLLGLMDPAAHLMAASIVCFTLVFLSASQDIVIDAIRIEMLEAPEYGTGAATVVLGYRLGMLASRAGALYVAFFARWPVAYALMAALVAIGAIGFLIAREPAHPPKQDLRFAAWLRHAVLAPLADFTHRRGWAGLLLFMMLYKLGSDLTVSLSGPLYVHLGFSKIEVANITKVFGVIALIVGGFAGAYVIKRLGIWRALFICGILQAAAQFAFAWLALAGHDLTVLTITIGAEQFTGGMATSALVAFLSAQCNRDYTATQYALFLAMVAVGRDLLTAPAGYLQEQIGWLNYYLVVPLAALPGLALLVGLRRTINLPPIAESDKILENKTCLLTNDPPSKSLPKS